MTKNSEQRPTRHKADELQIQEYIATNRHGLGDHSFTIAAAPHAEPPCMKEEPDAPVAAKPKG